VLDAVASWEVPNAAAAVVARDGSVLETWGDVERSFRLASISKVMTGWATMVAVEEGTIALDQDAGQPHCTIRHLLAHAGGYAFDGPEPIVAPERRRIYSNTGIELVAGCVEEAAEMPFGDYLAAAVFEPLGMHTAALRGSAAHSVHASVRDVIAFLGELQRPRLLSPAGSSEAVTVQYPALAGIVPGVGRFDPCPWGLGIEIRGSKSPHWTGTSNSPATFGHFGGAGTMTWVDPAAGCGLVALTDRDFDSWPDAVAAWSALSDDVVAAVSA
jgi:CubicO group peptidase (beta-lactamase class C family)